MNAFDSHVTPRLPAAPRRTPHATPLYADVTLSPRLHTPILTFVTLRRKDVNGVDAVAGLHAARAHILFTGSFTHGRPVFRIYLICSFFSAGDELNYQVIGDWHGRGVMYVVGGGLDQTMI